MTPLGHLRVKCAKPLTANPKIKLLFPVCMSDDITYLKNMEFFKITENLKKVWGPIFSSLLQFPAINSHELN